MKAGREQRPRLTRHSMTDLKPSDASARQPGRLTRALAALYMKQATVARSEALDPSFRLITLESPQFKDLSWTLGQKVQISIGASLATRTYTPIEWDSRRGRRASWPTATVTPPAATGCVRRSPGDACLVFGPRASLNVSALPEGAVIFGDETSFALAAAVACLPTRGLIQYLFEANAPDAARSILAILDLEKAMLVGRRDDETHLDDIATRLAGPAASRVTFVLTGKAGSVQRLRRVLKRYGVPPARIMTKAYWAPGKKGLDEFPGRGSPAIAPTGPRLLGLSREHSA